MARNLLRLMSSKIPYSKLIPSDEIYRVFSDRTQNYKAFRFDHVFEEASSQSQIFDQSDITTLIDRVAQGFNATVFVYGQTGSGKTFTMEGYKY